MTITTISPRELELEREVAELKAKLAEVPQIRTTPVAYQYKYGDYWRCSTGEQINGIYPTKARSLYVMKDEA